VSYTIVYHNQSIFGGGGDRRTAQVAEVEVAEATLMQRTLNDKKSPVSGKAVKVKSDSEGTLTVLVKGDNVFGTTVSKSFARADISGRIDTISISIASYRVVQVRSNIMFSLFRAP